MKRVSIQRTQQRLSRAVCTTGLLSVFAAVSCGDAETVNEENIKQTMIVDGTRASKYQFQEVVRLKSFAGECTGTAIANDTVLTAAHCVTAQYGGGVKDYVWVGYASGDNKSSMGAVSSYFVVHDGRNDNRTGRLLERNDLALVIFGPGTFKAFAEIGSPWGKLWQHEATTVGYGTNSRNIRRYRKVKVDANLDYYSQNVLVSPHVVHSGDSGGPWLLEHQGIYRVVGVTGSGYRMSMMSGPPKLASSFLNPERAAGIRRYLKDVQKYCVAGYEKADYEGRSWSFCNRRLVNDALGEVAKNERFTMYLANKPSDWNDKISSIKTGERVNANLFADSGNGRCSGQSWQINEDADLRGDGADNKISCIEPRFACKYTVNNVFSWGGHWHPKKGAPIVCLPPHKHNRQGSAWERSGDWNGRACVRNVGSYLSARCKEVKQVSVRNSHVCELQVDGSVFCWGDDSRGQSTPPAGKTFKQISTGLWLTCGLETSGAVSCWGDNQHDQSTPPAGKTFKQISATLQHVCGVEENGAVSCWGHEGESFAKAAAGKSFKQVSTSWGHVCGVEVSGAVFCWGRNEKGQSTPPAGKEFKQVAVYNGTSCGLEVGGAVSCWGDNGRGQSTPPAGKTFKQISVGSFHGCGVEVSGAVSCWGDKKLQLTPPTGRTFKQVSVGSEYTCGLEERGAVFCWGAVPRRYE